LVAPSLVKQAAAASLEQPNFAANPVTELVPLACSPKQRRQHGRKKKTQAHSLPQKTQQAQRVPSKMLFDSCFEQIVPRRAAYQIFQGRRTEPLRSAAQLQRDGL
jgi:hypothetical protein